MHVQWVAKYIIYSWNLSSFFEFFYCGWTFEESNNNKPFQIWWTSETKRLVIKSTLRIWSLILSPQIRQSEARCWTWLSIRLITLFWPWKEKKAKARINAKKSNNTALRCLRETREWNTFVFWTSKFKNCLPKFHVVCHPHIQRDKS